jgi:pectate lyase
MNMRVLLLLVLFMFIFSLVRTSAQDSLIIQENTLGVCTMDGDVETDAEGYTGEGYANIANGIGIGMSWSINVSAAGTYNIFWRYALGGSDVTSRDAALHVNYVLQSDTIKFPHSGSSLWSVWIMTDTIAVYLEEGENNIRLSSVTSKGLPNIDYFQIKGGGITPTSCTPAFTFSIGINNPDAGSVWYEPIQEYYVDGTEITVHANENEGYFFHSWSGEASGTDSNYTFTITENTYMTALLYPSGTTMDPAICGYATVQHDNGTPYLLTGGLLGDTVEATSLAELISYLGDEIPRIVKLSKYIEGSSTDEIKINLDKTLIGTNDLAHIKGVKVAIDGSRNVIIKNVTFSKVLSADEIEINGGARNVWIDHCELFTDRDHDNNEDYYDGLLDIKNGSSFITVSWCYLHDHNKGVLISSGDDSSQDSVQRITFHHNYFYNCNSRLPSIRFGKAHIFNNFYEGNNTAVNTRMNACVRVEKNYFLNTNTGVGMLYSPVPGSVELIDNIFENTSYSDSPTCQLDVPYSYELFIDNPEDLPALIPLNIRSIPASLSEKYRINGYELFGYPNPAKSLLTITFKLPEKSSAIITVHDMLGYEIMALGNNLYDAGWNKVELGVTGLKPGIYLYKLKSEKVTIVKRLVIQ